MTSFKKISRDKQTNQWKVYKKKVRFACLLYNTTTNTTTPKTCNNSFEVVVNEVIIIKQLYMNFYINFFLTYLRLEVFKGKKKIFIFFQIIGSTIFNYF